MPKCPLCSELLSNREAESGKCPACGGRLEKQPTLAGGRVIYPLAKQSAPKSFELQAAQASVAAPLVVMIASCCGWPMMHDTMEDNPQTASTVATIVIGLFLIILAAGFVFGVIGLNAGFRQRSPRLIFWSGIGLVLTFVYSMFWIVPLLSN